MKNVKNEKKNGEGKEDIFAIRDKMKKLQEDIENYIDNMEIDGAEKENEK